MTKIKLEHVDNLRRGKKSGAKIGSRWVPHHLYKYEEEKYDRALKYKFLEITTKDRVNLKNLWEKVCLAKWWNNYILEKDTSTWNAIILQDSIVVEFGESKNMKKIIKTYV